MRNEEWWWRRTKFKSAAIFEFTRDCRMPCVNKISIKSGWLGLYVLKPLYRSRVDREPLAMWFFCLMAAMPKGSCKPARLPHCLSL